jgi:heme oxygenase
MDVPGLQFERRRRLAGLAASLMRLGAAMPVNAPPPPRLPGSRSEALGLLYVLEGSTLGGRVILRQLASTGMDLDGLGFLDPYGSESGRMWRQFLELLEIHVSGSETGIEQAVIGARNGFEWAEACLCKRPTKTRNAA